MNVSAFNVSLIGDGKGGSQGAYNQTGNGTFCLKDLGERVKWGLEMAGLKQEGTFQVSRVSLFSFFCSGLGMGGR